MAAALADVDHERTCYGTCVHAQVLVPTVLRPCQRAPSPPSEWLARDPARLGASLEQFVGHPAYGPGELRGDVEGFVFLLGGRDGERPFGP